MAKVSRADYDKIVKIYNELGMKAAMEYIEQNYGNKYPRDVLTRIKKSHGYSYDAATNKIITSNEAAESSIFMDIDELCKPIVAGKFMSETTTSIEDKKDITIEMLYQELMQEKFIELTRYIRLNRYLNTISIDKTALMANGYQVSIH